jgi:bifunctional DNase/RNase
MSEERVEVKVQGVYMHQEQEMPAHHFVLLRAWDGRRLPIWVGQFEAWAISFALEGDVPEHPMTHDLMLALVRVAGARVIESAIIALRNEMFYATVTLRIGAQLCVQNSRPSDAIALALRARCPIFVTEAVMAAESRTD